MINSVCPGLLYLASNPMTLDAPEVQVKTTLSAPGPSV